MTAPVFIVTATEMDSVAVGATFQLRGPEARHAIRVMRMGPGEAIDLVDGAGRRAQGIVRAVSNELTIDIANFTREDAPPGRITLVQALAKGGRDELAIETATETGVDDIVPWQAQRSVAKWPKDRLAKSHARWQACVQAAAKQSRRARVPKIAECVQLAGLTCLTAQVVADGGVVLLLDGVGAPFSQLKIAVPTWVVAIVGPEGGICPAEMQALIAAGGQMVRLGPEVLRASTAGPLVVGLLAQRLGRW